MVAARVGTSKGERSFPPPVRLPPSRLGASMSVPPFASLRAAAADERPVLVVLAGPDHKLFARYPRTLRNLRAAVGAVDGAFLFDNSSLDTPYRPVAVYADGRVAERFPPLPRWTRGLPGL